MQAQTLSAVQTAMKAYSSWNGEQGQKSLNTGRPFLAVACVLMFLQPADSQAVACSTLSEHVLQKAKESKFLNDQDRGIVNKAVKFVCTSADMLSLKMSRNRVSGQKLEVILGEQASCSAAIQLQKSTSLHVCACVVCMVFWLIDC
jgi:hypothetical protein